jgi:hypothetical protein
VTVCAAIVDAAPAADASATKAGGDDAWEWE